MAVDDDFVAVRAPRQEERENLAAIFKAIGALERASELRRLLVHLLAIMALPVWVAALWPAAISPGLRQAALAGWGLGLVMVLLSLLHEAWCRQQKARGMATLPPAALKSPASCAGDPEAES